MEEAIIPMRKDVFNALPEVHSFIKSAIRRVPKGGSAIIIGVGNSIGIPDTKNGVEDVRKVVEKLDAKFRAEEKSKKKGGWL